MPDKDLIEQQIVELIEKFESNSLERLKDKSEANIRKDFINPFFRILGWDIEDSDEFDAEQYIRDVGFVDIAIKIGENPIIFIEAKKVGGIKERRVRLIDGEEFDADWTDEERQILNYAGAKNIKWAILTNFEKFRLFNAKTGNTILDITKPREYLSRINELLLLTKEEVLNGNIDKLEDLEDLPDVDADFLKLLNRWRLSLAKEINRSFPNLEFDKLKLYVQRTLDRLVIIRYAEDKWILNNPNQLNIIKDLWKKTDYLDLSIILNQFFSGFEVEHNSKIFEKDEFVEEIINKIDNEILYSIIDELYLQNFRKFTSDILGSTYESYLSLNICFDDNNELVLKHEHKRRKKKGIYYTPPYIVKQIVYSTLGQKLENLWEEIVTLFNNKEYENAISKFNEIYDIKVLDPACGSGSFLIEAHDLFVKYHERYSVKVEEAIKELKKDIKNGRRQSWEVFRIENELKSPLNSYEKKILKNNIYGVDLDQTAAEIASVNLMLRALKSNEKLPLILYENIKVGNSLITGVDDLTELNDHANEIKELIEYREKIKITTNLDEKKNLEKEYREIKEQIDEELNENLYDYFSDLDEIKPFNWEIEFPEVFYDNEGNLKNNGGFDVVIGNPPYFNVQTLGAGSHEIEYIKNKYQNIWMDKSDILFYFIARAVELSNHYISYIVSNAFLFADKAKKLRNFILEDAPISNITNFERYRVFKDASITTAIIKLDKLKDDTIANTLAFSSSDYSEEEICETIQDQSKYREIEFKKNEVFAIVSYEVEMINNKVDDDYPKLGDLVFVGKGMETAANPVFTFESYPSQFDSQFIKKRLNNEVIQPYVSREEKEYLLYYEDVANFEDLPTEIQDFLNLDENKNILEDRATVRDEGRIWWKYSRPLHKDYYNLNKIWCPYRAQYNRFALDESSECIGLTDTTVIFDTNDEISLKYLLALLNSKLLTLRYKSIGKPTGGGIHEYFENQITKLPIPEIPSQEQDPFINEINKILDLTNQKKDLIKLYRNSISLSGQNYRFKKLNYYLEPRNLRDYHINLSETQELIDRNKEGIPKTYNIKKQGNSLFINVNYSDDTNEDVIKITFNNDNLREFFYLSIFSSIDGVTKRYSTEGNILERVKTDIEIPQSTNNKNRDVINIIELMDLIKDEYRSLLSQYSYNPINDADLDEIEKKKKDIQSEIDKKVYELYGLDPDEIQLVEEIIN